MTAAIVAVRFFGLARPIARYFERLASHDVALRGLGNARARMYGKLERLSPARGFWDQLAQDGLRGRVLPIVAVFGALYGLAVLSWTLIGQGNREVDELLAGYVRVAMSEHAVDVASSDRHTVKPWYAGRIDYAPPVYDLTATGFPLLGGRLDVIDGRKVAVLVYRRNQHKLALSLWPAGAAGNTAAGVTQRDGFAMAEWRHGGFEWRAVSDVSPTEMASFTAALDKALDSNR